MWLICCCDCDYHHGREDPKQIVEGVDVGEQVDPPFQQLQMKLRSRQSLLHHQMTRTRWYRCGPTQVETGGRSGKKRVQGIRCCRHCLQYNLRYRSKWRRVDSGASWKFLVAFPDDEQYDVAVVAVVVLDVFVD
jgi:hypothetical protein